jgi:hypothetical protein
MATVFTPSTIDGSIANRGPFQGKLFISGLPNFKNSGLFDISQYVTAVSVNYTMSMSSEIAFDVVDPGLNMSLRNYFVLGRDVIYETQTLGRIDSYKGELRRVSQLFEIASVNVTQGIGGSATYSIKCWTKAIQQMKRDKKPGTIKGTGTSFVKEAARKYGLQFYGEEISKKKTTTKASGPKQAVSLWNVLETMARDAEFVLFEVDGVLVFASEKFLFKKWGTNLKYSEKTTTNPKTKEKKIKKIANRFIPLQFPNDGPQYVGTPGYFYLTEHPSITKSANDPYAADGSCSVERNNGTQIRPGMTAYVGTIPNMSGYCIIESVSFNEMVSNPVSVSFRTITRDEEKDKIKLRPPGTAFQSTYISGETPITVKQAAKDLKGKPLSSPVPDKRIIGKNITPTSDFPFRYPSMPYANVSKTYGSFVFFKTPSTLDKDSLIVTGNMNLWNRPIFIGANQEIKTIYSITKVEQAGSEYRAIIIPTIYTSGSGQAIEVSEQEVIAAYNAAGGYAGSAKHMGVLRGDTKSKAILNARDYATLLSFQQNFILKQRFPNSNFGNTPGGPDSLWIL